MRFDQVTIAPDLTAARYASQRLDVTEFRDNAEMSETPQFRTIGGRVRYWREKRGLSRKELAAYMGQKPSTLADLENGNSGDSQRLDMIAIRLKVSSQYLRTGKGDPEAISPTERLAEPPPPSWPLDPPLLARLHDLDDIERVYFETQARLALQAIQDARRKRNKSG